MLLERYHSNRRRALFYRSIAIPDLQLDSKDRPLPGQEPYNAIDAICYRDNENGKAECDRKMLAELNALTPRGRGEKVDR